MVKPGIICHYLKVSVEKEENDRHFRFFQDHPPPPKKKIPKDIMCVIVLKD